MNALQSTGPKTLAGKRRSSQNAVKWGLFSKHVVLTEQDAQEWQLMAPPILAILQPMGESEELMADEVLANWFRLGRCLKIEAGLFKAYSNYQGRACGLGTAFAQAAQLDCFGKLSRYEQHLERKLALSLQRFQSARRSREETARGQIGAPTTPPPAPSAGSPRISSSQPAEANPTKPPPRLIRKWRTLVATMTGFWHSPNGSKRRLENRPLPQGGDGATGH